jgi:hypothetical protein
MRQGAEKALYLPAGRQGGNLLSHTPMDEIVLKRLTGLMMNVPHHLLTTGLIKLWQHPSRVIRVEIFSLFPIPSLRRCEKIRILEK